MTKITTSIALLSILPAASQAFSAPGLFSATRKITHLDASNGPPNEPELVGRRNFGQLATVSVVSAIGSTIFSPEPSVAAPPTGKPKRQLEKSNRIFFKGKVTIRDDDIPYEIQDAKNKALLLTARPKNPANIPPEVLASARGSVPAVFAAIVPGPTTFPQDFRLTSRDITPEGDFGLSGDPYWWADEPEWEISARVDTDGAVNTLDPTDLVGRTITSRIGEDKAEADICVSVQKRGFFGSYAQRNENV